MASLIPKNPWMTENFDETKMESLGKGKFAHVVKTVKKNDNTVPIAIKSSETLDVEDFNANLKEVINFARIGQHQNIVKFHDFYSFTESISIGRGVYNVQVAMECGDRSLARIISESKTSPPLPVQEVFNLAFDCLSAFKHMEEQTISHLDLKPANIIYFSNENIYKIADWAGAIESRSFRNFTKLSKRILLITDYYSAPEVIFADANVMMNLIKADMYSLALTLLECLGLNSRSSVKRNIVEELERLNLKGNWFKYLDTGNNPALIVFFTIKN